jgi:hypothetical protein
LTAFETDVPPRFEVQKDAHGHYLLLAGADDSLAVAYILTKTRLESGTYCYKALFSMSDDVNPQRNLLFQCKARSHDGIFKFYKLEGGMVEGREFIEIKGDKPRDVELRVYYRLNAKGEVKLRNLSFTPAEPVKPRWVRFACTQGVIRPEQVASVAAQAARDSVDLLLYPENFVPNNNDPVLGEKLMKLMSEMAAKYGIYVAGSVIAVDSIDGRKYNRGVLYDRSGALAGVYDKIHPYSHEINDAGVKPGSKTDVFRTEFGKV